MRVRGWGAERWEGLPRGMTPVRAATLRLFIIANPHDGWEGRMAGSASRRTLNEAP